MDASGRILQWTGVDRDRLRWGGDPVSMRTARRGQPPLWQGGVGLRPDHPSVGLFGSNVSGIVSEWSRRTFKFTLSRGDFFIAFLLLAHFGFLPLYHPGNHATVRHWNPTEVKHGA
ncbi:hypothetical protein BV898_18939 [Hypsibius exemplaris]|uniref:Uncharacterized protein n=1 Tax=Hypsibius exemplaris TaxID=2072580 RepID=A0A9X6NJQ8_HYPEX|nr:hypothetical protein BV898_18939 [Hypsibius exemplaris]